MFTVCFCPLMCMWKLQYCTAWTAKDMTPAWRLFLHLRTFLISYNSEWDSKSSPTEFSTTLMEVSLLCYVCAWVVVQHWIYVYAYSYKHTYIHIFMHVFYVYVCLCVSMCVNIYIYIYMLQGRWRSASIQEKLLPIWRSNFLCAALSGIWIPVRAHTSRETGVRMRARMLALCIRDLYVCIPLYFNIFYRCLYVSVRGMSVLCTRILISTYTHSSLFLHERVFRLGFEPDVFYSS